MFAKKRKIVLKNGDVLETPLLLPSFSSKTFQDEDVAKIMAFMSGVITDEVLISAYDMLYGHLRKKITFPSAIFIDSGGYEASLEGDLSETGKKGHKPKRWTQEYHRRVLKRWDRSINTIVVSFDSLRAKTSVAEQIQRARKLFSDFSYANSEILFKTVAAKSPFLDIPSIVKHRHELSQFDIIGFTEKELGKSTLERMFNIATVRQSLSEASIEAPIHVFGSLDTITTPLYFLAGADIFDGLTWLRFAFDRGQTIYKHNYGAERLGIRLEDFRVNAHVWNANYYYMREMKDDMLKFLVKGDFASFRYNSVFFADAVTQLMAKLKE